MIAARSGHAGEARGISEIRMSWTSISGVRLFALALGPFLLLIALCIPLVSQAKPGLNAEFIDVVAQDAALALAGLALVAPRRFPWAAYGAGVLAATWFAAASPTAGSAVADWLRATPTFLLIPAAWIVIERLDGRGRTRPSLRERALANAGAPGDDASAGRLGSMFASKLTWLLAAHPGLVHEGEISAEGSGFVWFPKANDDGFDVRVVVEPGEVQVYAGSVAHLHFLGGPDPSLAASSSLACVHDLLTAEVRLRERVSRGSRPYGAWIERRTPEGWRVAARTFTVASLVLWLGGGPERIRQNRQLPSRGA